MTTTDVRTVIGATFKLESEKGTLLGTVTIPFDWADRLRNRGGVCEFYLPSASPIMSWDKLPDPTNPVFTIKRGALFTSPKYYSPQTLHLYGVTLEEFETIPGCSFAPSAAYLRSIVE